MFEEKASERNGVLNDDDGAAVMDWDSIILVVKPAEKHNALAEVSTSF